MKEFMRAVKFTLFSISAGLIEIGSFALLNELLHLPYWLSYGVALVLSVLWNFTLNRSYTFHSAANVPVAMAKVAAFYAVFLPLSSYLEHFLTTELRWNEYLVTAINMGLNFVTEFFYQRFFVFGKTLDTMEKGPSPLYRFIKRILRLVYPTPAFEGLENLPNEPALIVSNHAQMHGPILFELYLPGTHYIWCAEQMMHRKEVAEYAYRDFWSQKPSSVRWLYKIAAHLIVPLAVLIFNNANTIPVYWDSRIVKTFRLTMEKLAEGANVVIFPEHDAKGNHIVYDFQQGFVDVARLYYKRTGQALSFVPAYAAPALKKVVIGRPVRFSPEAPTEQERARILEYLSEEITRMARALPRHRVVPYRNIPKKDYPMNDESEGTRDAAKDG